MSSSLPSSLLNIIIHFFSTSLPLSHYQPPFPLNVTLLFLSPSPSSHHHPPFPLNVTLHYHSPSPSTSTHHHPPFPLTITLYFHSPSPSIFVTPSGHLYDPVDSQASAHWCVWCIAARYVHSKTQLSSRV